MRRSEEEGRAVGSTPLRPLRVAFSKALTLTQALTHFLRAVDHKIASLIERALAEVCELTIVGIGEDAVRRTKHDGHLRREGEGVEWKGQQGRRMARDE